MLPRYMFPFAWDFSLNCPMFPLGPKLQKITVFLNSWELLKPCLRG